MLRLKLELKEKSLQFRLRARPPDKRIFSPLTVPRLCDTIGRYWYLFKRLTAVSAARFYRFEHIDADSSFKALSKQRAISRPAWQRIACNWLDPQHCQVLTGGVAKGRCAVECWRSESDPRPARSRSRIRKIAPETDNAQTNSVATTVTFWGAKRPKLKKMMTNQKTSVTRNCIGIEPPLCSKSNQRMCPRSAVILSAWAWSER